MHLMSEDNHQQRYLSEYDFSYNHHVALGFNDGNCTALAVKNSAGRRQLPIDARVH